MKKLVSILAIMLAVGLSSQAQPVKKLYNGKDLSGWQFFLLDKTVHTGDVFKADGENITISGQPFGAMYTATPYENYVFEAEWRWPAKESNSGIFICCQDNILPGERWYPAYECQLKAGNAGDIVHMGGSKSDWPLRLRAMENATTEKPTGEWNHARIEVNNRRAKIYINGVLQNELSGIPRKGRIALQSEGGPVQFRNVTIQELPASEQQITLHLDEVNKKVDVWYDDALFTSYCFDEKYEKPTFYPVLSPSGQTVTRGFPYQPRPYEHADHPHQVGLTFVFGNVNGIDFWNNSYARAAEDKYKYGSIRNRRITSMESGREGRLSVETEWIDHKGNVLLTEQVTYTFAGEGDTRTIERRGKLTAAGDDVKFSDNKEGLFVIRLDKTFEEPSKVAELHTDKRGYLMPEKTIVNNGTVGVFTNDKGEKMEAEVFGKPTRWLANTTTRNNEKLTVVLIDNPRNPGYPARAFSRGYGMMAINNMGTKCYIDTEQPYSMTLKKGESAEFAHKFMLVGGREVAPTEIESAFEKFSK